LAPSNEALLYLEQEIFLSYPALGTSQAAGGSLEEIAFSTP
jgi:hypothetical protein